MVIVHRDVKVVVYADRNPSELSVQEENLRDKIFENEKVSNHLPSSFQNGAKLILAQGCQRLLPVENAETL